MISALVFSLSLSLSLNSSIKQLEANVNDFVAHFSASATPGGSSCCVSQSIDGKSKLGSALYQEAYTGSSLLLLLLFMMLLFAWANLES